MGVGADEYGGVVSVARQQMLPQEHQPRNAGKFRGLAPPIQTNITVIVKAPTFIILILFIMRQCSTSCAPCRCFCRCLRIVRGCRNHCSCSRCSIYCCWASADAGAVACADWIYLGQRRRRRMTWSFATDSLTSPASLAAFQDAAFCVHCRHRIPASNSGHN